MTYTILAVDREHDVIGVACATGGHACGGVVAALDPAVGAVASQAWVNPSLRGAMLAGLASSHDPDAAVDLALEGDPGASARQVAAIGLDGRLAVRTGSDCTDWAGHVEGQGFVVVGNHLVGRTVVESTAAALDAIGAPAEDVQGEEHVGADGGRGLQVTPGAVASLARVLISALEAGERAGGDSRGPRSAALLVSRMRATEPWPPEVDIDLRVDGDPAPLARLSTLLNVSLYGPGSVGVTPRTD